MDSRRRSFAGVLDALRQDVSYALRGIRSHPGFAATVCITIALGIGANATKFGVVDRLLFRGPEGVRDADQVMVVGTHDLSSPYSNTSFSYPSFTDLRDHPGGFAAVAMTYSGTFPIDRGANATSAPGALVSGNFFQTLGVQPALGRFIVPDDDDPQHPQMVAVVSYGFWQRHLGGRRDSIGSTINIGTKQYTVVGVAPRGFSGIDLKDVSIWLPITAPRAFASTTRRIG